MWTRLIESLRSRSDIRQFISFILVGILNSGFGYGVFAILVLLGMYHEAALVLSTILGVVFNYVTTGRIVFDNKTLKPIVAFAGGYTVTLIINIYLLRFAVASGIDPLLGQLFALAIVLVLRVQNRILLQTKIRFLIAARELLVQQCREAN